MAFRLYRSNRAEKLAEALSEVARRPLAQVFARECIVVQGPGMERWLSAVLAQRLGIWANPWFPFPRTAIELILDATLGPTPEEAAAFAPGALAFRVARQLPALLGRPGFHDVARYLEADAQHERLVALSRRIAATFDQYLVYRPELIVGWENGTDQHFQAELWRALCVGQHEPQHLARRVLTLLRRDALKVDAAKLPERISLFGISTLPPAFLNVLRAAARHIDLHMFVLSPARGYWGDLDHTQRHDHDVQGLLANLGKSSRELLELLVSGEEPDEDAEDLFVIPSSGSLLAGLQADLVELAQRGKGTSALPPRPVQDSDDSLRVHACHSRTRELEVLRDELRDRLERDASLTPNDIVVFAPDVELYAPAIEAVFTAGGAEEDAQLPFRIADRRPQRASELSSAFLAVLDLLGSRMELSELLDLLHRPLVRRRFGIDESELDRAQRWLHEAGARWAVDAGHRASFGQPAFAENSLRFAIDRLLLGYASADAEVEALFGVLPCHAVEGQAAELLGRVARYVEALAELALDFAQARPVTAWADALIRAFSATLEDVSSRSLEQQTLRTLIVELGREADSAGFDAPVALKVMRTLIEERLERERLNGGFLAGGITFCEHVPMRAIPFRIVCLLGMDDESFPRSSARPSFDLMETARIGDRNVRDDDRQLFLEALLSARDALLISYVGRSAQDDSIRPRSALVDHLLRVIERHFVQTSADQTLHLGLEGSVSQMIARDHALHRFDRRYFRAQSKGRFFSYDQRALLAARAQLSRRQDPPAFVARPLAGLATPAELSISGLERFFRNPQRAFLRERLSVHLPRDLDPVANREPTRLNALERYQIGEELLHDLAELSAAERARVLSLSGKLPPGMGGAVQLEDIEALVEAVRSVEDPGPALPDRDIEIQLGSVKLVGRLDRLFERARVERMLSIVSTKHLLSAWIRHLALCASGPTPDRTLVVGRKGDEPQVFELSFVANAGEELETLVALYMAGMQMPLPYLHNASQMVLDKLAKGAERADALAAASSAALPSARGAARGSEGDDEHVRQVFSLRQLEHLASLVTHDAGRELGFIEVAERILAPMQRHKSAKKT